MSHRSIGPILMAFSLIVPSSMSKADEDAIAEDFQPEISAASAEGERAIAGFQKPAGFRVELFAAEPLLANPVALWVDHLGRIYIAETFRHHAGVTDTRGHMYWLDDDLASRTVEDRVKMYRKHLGTDFAGYAGQHDRVRLVYDEDGDGVADKSTVFADGFQNHADGIGAGVLTHQGNVYYTCIPDLWLLRDTDGDGSADERKSLHYGYGVHVGFLGHDLHGLRIGPDGKLYFSIGDRGLNVHTDEGHLFYPDTGTVLRCNLDGSELEVFAEGLRNPQELAFDEYGNLFTGDNNSDGGDQARLVYLVEGSDSGWRIGYQFMSNRGPWNEEKLWHPQHAGQAAYLVAPIANFADGPSGLTYYPGLGLPERYERHFFLCDFRGTSGQSGIRAFKFEPNGAFYKLAADEKFLWSVLATDVDFGPDGALYLTDWVEGWDKPTKGRIYRVYHPESRDSAQVEEARELLASGLNGQSFDDLVDLLSHPDMRIRQSAQFRLAGQGAESIATLSDLALHGDHQLARIHAIWGLGQIGRDYTEALRPLVTLLQDQDPEIRAQAARVAGDARLALAYPSLLRLLRDKYPRARMYAALGLGKLGRAEATHFLFQMLRENWDEDPVLRHAGVMGLVGCRNVPALVDAARDASVSARLGALLALRRLKRPEVTQFLQDSNQLVLQEAARAIHDTPIPDGTSALAWLSIRDEQDFVVVRRVLNALRTEGTAAAARRLAEFAANAEYPPVARREALEILSEWTEPAGRDRVVGLWRPLPSRPADEAAIALPDVLETLFDAPQEVQLAAVRAAHALKIQAAESALRDVALNAERSEEVRVAAWHALAELDVEEWTPLLQQTVSDPSDKIRAVAREYLSQADPALAFPELKRAVEEGTLYERQHAWSALGASQDPRADALIRDWVQKLIAGEVPAETQLDVLLAAEERQSNETQTLLDQFQQAAAERGKLGPYEVALAGGDAERGEEIFFERDTVSCQRCHQVGDRGGRVGPDLTKIAAEKDRRYLLEALVEPNKAVAKGFESVTLVTLDGEILTGVVLGENASHLQLINAEAEVTNVPLSEIDERYQAPSAMPEDLMKHLTLSEIRDLVEFLAQRK